MEEELERIDHTDEFDCPECHRARSLRWQYIEKTDGENYFPGYVLACRDCGYVDYDSEHMVDDEGA